MTLTGNPDDQVYRDSENVPGVGVPEQEDDGALGGISNEPLGGLDNTPLGGTPSVSSTKVPKPDVGSAIYAIDPMYFDEQGNYVQIQPVPVNRDYSNQITMALNRLQQQTSIMGVSNSFNESVVSFMAMPEFVSMINELNTDNVFPTGDEGRMEKQGKVILGELAADVGIQVLTAMRNADINRLLDSSYASTDEEMVESRNVITLMAELGPDMDPWMRQGMVTMLSSLPTKLYTVPDPVSGGMVHGFSNLVGSIMGQESRTYDEFAQDAAGPQVGRNFREQMAAKAMAEWRLNPPRTQEEKSAFMSWFYGYAEQLNNEARGLEGHLGSLGYTLDLPRQAVGLEINKVVNQLAFPNDTLDRTHLPTGDNLAYALGMSSRDASPSWVFDTAIGTGIDFGVENLVNVATPLGAAVSAYNVARGGEALDTPFFTEFYDEFRQANSFQLLSGGYQLSTFFWQDPVNWAAGIGLGYKSAQSIPRFAGVSRALQLRRAATPLRGARLTGVPGGMSARISHALMSDTISGMVAAGRGGNRAGTRLVRAFSGSDDTAAIIRKVPQLEGNRLVVPLKRLIDKGDIDGFWDMIELSMSGANEASNPFLFQSIKGKAAVAVSELHDATKKSLANGELGIRDVMTGLYGMHPNSTLYESIPGTAKRVVNAGDDVSAGDAAVASVVRTGSGSPRTILRVVPDGPEIVAPGASRTAVNHRLGWRVVNALDEKVIGRIREVDSHLADALTHLRDRQALQASVGALPNEMVSRLERAIDDVLEADAIAVGDDIMIGRSSEHKLVTGLDITTPEGTLAKVLPQQTTDAVNGTIVSDMLEGANRSVMLIDQMPRPKLAANFWAKAAQFTGTNSNLAVARFGRRLAASAKYVSPGDVDPSKVKEGLRNLKARLKIHGASRGYIDNVEDAWLRSVSNEDRWGVGRQALASLGDNVDNPMLSQGYADHIARFGETGYGKRAVGESFEEIGAAKTAGGEYYIAPSIVEHHQRTLQLGDAYIIEKEASRFRRAGKLPKQLVVGFGKTSKRRKQIAEAYKKQIIENRGQEAWLALGSDDAARNNVAMSMAFADMTDHTNRGVGLGKVNQAFSAVNRVHKGFHTTFTLAQLAGRPFAWASRVLMEEHVRGWLAGLPSLMSNPTGYLAMTWNAGMVNHVDTIVAKQLKQAESSAKLLFGGAMPMDEALRIADEIIPGWTKKISRAGVNLSDAGQVRAEWTSTLSKALNNNAIPSATRRAGVTNRVIRKQRSLDRIVRRHDEWFGFDPRVESWDDIVPEITGASLVNKFASETEGAIGEMRFTPNLKTKTRAAVAHAHAKKAQQVLGGMAGRTAAARMLQKLRGEPVTWTGERFARTRNWADIRHNVEDIARARNFVPESDAALAEWYLDVIMRQDWIEGNFKYFWGDSPAEKIRILDEIVTSRTATIKANGIDHTVTLRQNKYAEGKNAWAALFDDLDSAGRHEEVLPVMGVMSAYFAEEAAEIGKVKKVTNWILQNFGEDASQGLHRRPAYLAERRRYLDIYKRLGFDADEAAQIAHEKSFETVNWLFFNNHHTGELLRRMNKSIPFFSAWAEVMSTWAWKIPSMNVLGVGHGVMIHKIDNIMQAFVRMGIVEIDDGGQWRMNFEEDPSGLSPAGRGISAMGHRMMSTPTAVVMQAANIGNWLKSQINEEDYEAYELSDWAKNNYSIAIGSPVKLNSHGIMGVNQFAFGFTPDISYLGDLAADKVQMISGALFSWADNPVAQRLHALGDAETISADTLADAYEQMPDTMSQSEFLALNRAAITKKIGLDSYNALFKSGNEFLPPATVDLTDVPLRLPNTSFFDRVVDPMLYPFGHIDTPEGVLRAVVPSSASYVLRGALGLYANGSAIGDGIAGFLTGPLQQYQIDGEVHTAMMALEAEDGTYTRINALNEEIVGLREELAALPPEEQAAAIVAGSDTAEHLAQLEEQLAGLDSAAAKRASDMAFHATMSRGLTGLFGPATPRQSHADQVFKSEYYATKEIAEVLNETGSFDWKPLWESGAIKSKDDFLRANVEIAKWYNDPSGGETKAFILDNYPSLLAWLTPSTYWGPAGSPPLGRDMDTTMDAIMAGSKQRLPDDVVMQKMWRTVTEAQYESDLIAASGTNDQREQALWALNNPDLYQGIRDGKRNSLKSLDYYDDFYNDGNYHKYRESADDAPSVFEQWEEELFALNDAVDEVLDAVAHAGIASNDEQDTISGIVRASLGEFWDARREALDNMGVSRKFWSEREEFLHEYNEQVMRPYTDAVSEAFALVDEAESAAERGVAFEMLREADNEHYGQQRFVNYDGLTYRVPNELQRRWDLKTEEEREEQIQEWSGLDVKYLSEFAIDTMVDNREGFRDYLPWEQPAQRIISNATQEKSALLAEVRASHRDWSSYEKRIALDNIEAEMQNNLVAAGHSGVVQYMEAWPIERLTITGTLPPELGQVAGWFIGIHKDLDSIGQSATSDQGSDMFREFGDTLDTYWLQHPDQELKFKSVGEAMFGERANWALYYRFAGVRFGDAGE